MKDYLRKYTEVGHDVYYVNAHDIKSSQIQCGYCGSIVAPHHGFSIRLNMKSSAEVARIYKCPHCMNPIIYFPDAGETIPGKMFGREIKNLPDSIHTLYSECRTCYANQCYTASQMIARTILMHLAVELGADQNKSFIYYVDYMDSKGYIPPNGKAWVDFIRSSGNMANHEIIIKEKEETEKVITFLSTLLLVIYELPNEIENG